MTTEHASATGGETAVSREIYVDPALAVFKGHFPGMPMVPAALLVEWMLKSLPDGKSENARWTVLRAKFTKTVEPGSTIEIIYTKHDDEYAVEITSPAGSHATARFRRDK